MTWTLEQVKEAATQLTAPDDHTAYRVEGDTVVGLWAADAQWGGPTGGAAQSDTYRFEVQLSDHQTYTTHEFSGSSQAGGSAQASGGVSVHGEKSFFSGRERRWSFEVGAAPQVSAAGDDPGTTSGYTFDSERVKQPVLQLLEAAGWSREGGLLSRVFGNRS